MKAILTLLFVMLFGVLAVAQEVKGSQDKLQEVNHTPTSALLQAPESKIPTKPDTSVARLYRFKYSKVYKELTFTTRKNSPKLA